MLTRGDGGGDDSDFYKHDALASPYLPLLLARCSFSSLGTGVQVHVSVFRLCRSNTFVSMFELDSPRSSVQGVVWSCCCLDMSNSLTAVGFVRLSINNNNNNQTGGRGGRTDE